MNSFRIKFSLLALAVITFAACGKTVTNYAAPTNSSTPTERGSGQSSGSTEGSGGGVINGGGGRGVLCHKDGKTSVEVLDLYESRVLYNRKNIDFGSDENVAKEKLAMLLATHLRNPSMIAIDKLATYYKGGLIQNLINSIRFLEKGKHLRLINDAYNPTVEEGCESVQIAHYYDESVLLVDRALWDQLNMTNKAALIAHEFVYYTARQNGVTNSMATRKLVGLLFSETPPKPLYKDVPEDRQTYLDCSLSTDQFNAGYFILYASRSENGIGLQAVFQKLGTDGFFFRTRAFFENLSIAQLFVRDFAATRVADLERDTYPARDSVSLELTGIHDGDLTGRLSTSRGSLSGEKQTYQVRCRMPSDAKKLAPKTNEAANYTSKENQTNSKDEIHINENGGIEIEQVRQVGGFGGISDIGVVPFPTTCHTIEHGFIVSATPSAISYISTSVDILSDSALDDSQHCGEYRESFNRKALDGSLRFSLDMNQYKKM